MTDIVHPQTDTQIEQGQSIETAQKPEIKVKGRVTAIIALLIALSVAGASGYFYYQSLLIAQSFRREIKQLNQQLVATRELSVVHFNQLQQNLTDTQNTLAKLSGAKLALVNYQVNELVGLANQGLLIYHDIPGAITLLNEALNVLGGNNNPAFAALKLAISADLERLRQLPVLDSVVINGQLDGVLSQLGTLHLVSHNLLTKADPSSTNVKKSNWQLFLDNIRDTLADLIRVSKAQTTAQLALLPDQEVIIRTNLKLDILSARLALLQHDNSSWRYYLANAQNLLNQYFVQDSAVINITTTLNKLSNLPVGSEGANIDATLGALNKLNSLIVIN